MHNRSSLLHVVQEKEKQSFFTPDERRAKERWLFPQAKKKPNRVRAKGDADVRGKGEGKIANGGKREESASGLSCGEA